MTKWHRIKHIYCSNVNFLDLILYDRHIKHKPWQKLDKNHKGPFCTIFTISANLYLKIQRFKSLLYFYTLAIQKLKMLLKQSTKTMMHGIAPKTKEEVKDKNSCLFNSTNLENWMTFITHLWWNSLEEWK